MKLRTQAVTHQHSAGRKTKGSMVGEVLFGGHAPTRAFLRRHTGYVEQFDTLIGVLTVREMLMYTAEMKRPVDEPLAEKERVVDHYIEVLGLEDCKDTKIGNVLSRCEQTFTASGHDIAQDTERGCSSRGQVCSDFLGCAVRM